jgi:TrmH family RNA methyltransferase
VEETITSRENAKIKYACRLSGSAAFRQAENAFLAEGLKLCPALAKGALIKVIFYTDRALEKAPELQSLPGEHYRIPEHVAEKLADVGTNQGVFAIFEMPHAEESTFRAGGRYLALEAVQDPGNVGTLLRSAAAFGFDGVILDKACASPWAPKTLRASMGAAVEVPVWETEDLPATLLRLGGLGVTCLAAALYHSEPLDTAAPVYPGGVCVVIGSEGQGLTEAAVAACGKTVRIPMTDKVESLNAGIAGSILLWHFRGVGR